MKWLRVLWLLTFAVWGNVIFIMASIDLWYDQTNIYRVMEFCLQAFTLPAVISYLALVVAHRTVRMIRRSLPTRWLRAAHG